MALAYLALAAAVLRGSTTLRVQAPALAWEGAAPSVVGEGAELPSGRDAAGVPFGERAPPVGRGRAPTVGDPDVKFLSQASVEPSTAGRRSAISGESLAAAPAGHAAASGLAGDETVDRLGARAALQGDKVGVRLRISEVVPGGVLVSTCRDPAPDACRPNRELTEWLRQRTDAASGVLSNCSLGREVRSLLAGMAPGRRTGLGSATPSSLLDSDDENATFRAGHGRHGEQDACAWCLFQHGGENVTRGRGGRDPHHHPDACTTCLKELQHGDENLTKGGIGRHKQLDACAWCLKEVQHGDENRTHGQRGHGHDPSHSCTICLKGMLHGDENVTHGRGVQGLHGQHDACRTCLKELQCGSDNLTEGRLGRGGPKQFGDFTIRVSDLPLGDEKTTQGLGGLARHDQDHDCTICWSELENAETLSCGHCFCAACIRKWLEKVPACPLCRATMPRRLNPVDLLCCSGRAAFGLGLVLFAYMGEDYITEVRAMLAFTGSATFSVNCAEFYILLGP